MLFLADSTDSDFLGGQHTDSDLLNIRIDPCR